jgi:hypothetical protein
VSVSAELDNSLDAGVEILDEHVDLGARRAGLRLIVGLEVHERASRPQRLKSEPVRPDQDVDRDYERGC